MDEIHRKYHPASNLFPLMRDDEFENLKSDIAEQGLLEPIWLHPDGSVLDGRNRHRACIEIGVQPKFRQYEGCNPVAFSISQNVKRRHLSQDQLATIAVASLPLIEDEARQRQVAGVNGSAGGRGNKRRNLEVDQPQGFREEQAPKRQPQSRDIAGAAVGVSGSKVGRTKKIAESAPELFDQIKDGKITIKDAEREIRDRDRAQVEAEAERRIRQLPPNIHLHHGDFREVCETIPDHSVDFILTDPPYPQEFLPLWEDLAVVAKRILKPGGYLFAYSGQNFLPEIYQMMGRHLDYQWTAAVKHRNGYTRIWKVDVLNSWKPVLIYSNGKPSQLLRGMQDIISGGQGDKDAHEWAQPEAEAEYYIKTLTLPGQTVLDPFMGSGTVPRVAHRLNRTAIGIELDRSHYISAKESI